MYQRMMLTDTIKEEKIHSNIYTGGESERKKARREEKRRGRRRERDTETKQSTM
jgi:hypothetical protein